MDTEWEYAIAFGMCTMLLTGSKSCKDNRKSLSYFGVPSGYQSKSVIVISYGAV